MVLTCHKADPMQSHCFDFIRKYVYIIHENSISFPLQMLQCAEKTTLQPMPVFMTFAVSLSHTITIIVSMHCSVLVLLFPLISKVERLERRGLHDN